MRLRARVVDMPPSVSAGFRNMVSETCRHRDGKRGSEDRVNEKKKKKTWNDFSSGQKAAMIVLG